MTRIALWGGLECTVNRVGETFFDQVERTGHGAREDDIDRIHRLGIEAIRYPLLWERMADATVTGVDFAWADRRMARIRERGMQPIGGLVHHGSGPRGVSLLDRSFASGLGRFADRIARRYPWVKMFTPVNEPLTTARFSALYGHWYPHARSDASFVAALLNQVHAIRTAMASIRRHVPDAVLVQTEDIGTMRATPAVQYQADFENERRWLSLDLLTGRVDRSHAMWDYLVESGASAADLEAFCAAPCHPGVVGVNYYVTSDRYLDEHVERYPEHVRGSNGKHVYADVEAVRALDEGIVGHAEVLERAWERYRLPVALTEVHLGCHPEEQVRWLREAWQGAHLAAARGADVRAITPWSLFGSFDWDSLVTRDRGHYERGAFDVRAPEPEPTAVAHAVVEIAVHRDVRNPLAALPGWWRRPERLLFAGEAIPEAEQDAASPPVVVLGAEGLLGRSLVEACTSRKFRAVGVDGAFVRSDRRADLASLLLWHRPWLVFCCPAVREPRVAEACHAVSARFACFSSGLRPVDSAKNAAWDDELDPGDAITDATSEEAARLGHPGALVFRLAASHAPDIAHACLDFAVAGTSGIVHLADQGPHGLLARALGGA